MPRENGTGPFGQGPRTGRGFGRGRDFGGGRGQGIGFGSIGRKSTLGGMVFTIASMLIGNWLDKKFFRKKDNLEKSNFRNEIEQKKRSKIV